MAEAPIHALVGWLRAERPAVVDAAAALAAQARPGASVTLPGPTGERNVYTLAPRSAVLCLAADDDDRLVQLAAVLAVGGRAVWPAETRGLLQRLPAQVQAQVSLVRDGTAAETPCEAVLLHGSGGELARVQDRLSQRAGPVIGVERMAPGERDVPLERLVTERSLSINTAAAGGNASLMSIG